MTKTRFAPSPTGYLHLGNARTALLNFLFAGEQGGEFILRIDDTDKARSTVAYEEAIKEDLLWLGLAWGSTFKQSERLAEYEAAAEQLKSKGFLYPCYETEEELALMRQKALAASRPPVYDRAALSLTADERKSKEAAGIKPHWRFKLSQQEVRVEDLLHADMTIKTDSLSDPILIRADGSFLYTLPSVLDDLTYGITHIIRGDDHLTNSAAQIELVLALDGKPPVFAHHPLMVNEDGTPLSKRYGDFSLRAFREQGFEPEALKLLLQGGEDFQTQATHNVRFERARLEKLNSGVIHHMAWEEARERLPQEINETDWQSLRANLTFLKEAKLWYEIIYGEPSFPRDALAQERDFLAKAQSLLPPAPLNEDSWQSWTKALGEATKRKGKALYLPLRLALTGQERGPEMKNLILLLGHEKISKRLII